MERSFPHIMEEILNSKRNVDSWSSSEPYQGLNPQIRKERQRRARHTPVGSHSFLTCHHHAECEDLQGREGSETTVHGTARG